MIHFICMVFVELWSTESKRKIQTENMWLRVFLLPLAIG